MSSPRMSTSRRLTRWPALAAAVVLGAAFPTASVSAAPPADSSSSSAVAESPRPLAGGRSAIYGGGPFYSGGQAVMDTLRASGFTTVFLWSIHVHPNGDLFYNDTRIISNGQYVGDPGWSARLRTLKQAPTSVNRIEVSVGAWGVPDWENIDNLIQAQGTGPSSILYRNFQVLRNITGADAVNDDDESHYDVDSTVAFARMAATLGYRFTIAPYTNGSFWASLKNSLGGLDRVYLQVYAGGSGNDPGTWIRQLGMPVDPGLWSKHGSGCSAGDSPAQVRQKMTAWHSAHNLPGGFMWLFDDIQRCSSQGSAADYAAAINGATGSGGNPDPVGGTITGLGGKCVDVNQASTTDGTRVQAWDCNGTSAQRWAWQGSALVALGKCLDVNRAGTANGTIVQLWTCNGTGAQAWQHRSDGSLYNPNSGKCLDIPGSNTTNGTQLIIWSCHGGANQVWRVT